MKALKKLYLDDVKPKLAKERYKNCMEVPKLTKIVLNRGLGEATSAPKIVETTVEQLNAISGQKTVVTKAKKSISNFKLREGQAIGAMVTLRSDRMYDFLTKLINIVLPKIRDFRGVQPNSFDGRGNYSMGIKEETVFPEINYENVDRFRGLEITIVTSAKTDDEAFELLSLLGMPFRKIENRKEI